MAKARPQTLASAVQTSALIVGTLVIINGLDLVLGLGLARFGIVPRTGIGLIGILFSPLIHANMAHVIANAVPLFLLLILLLVDRHYYPYRTLALIWFVTGFGTWLIGRGGSSHVGASGIVFGLVAYLIVAGILIHSWRSAIVAILVFVLFGGIFYGALPHPGPISWESHLCGLIAGIWAAKTNHP
jgi:membrane associated rhomboid family serine protease